MSEKEKGSIYAIRDGIENKLIIESSNICISGNLILNDTSNNLFLNSVDIVNRSSLEISLNSYITREQLDTSFNTINTLLLDSSFITREQLDTSFNTINTLLLDSSFITREQLDASFTNISNIIDPSYIQNQIENYFKNNRIQIYQI